MNSYQNLFRYCLYPLYESVIRQRKTISYLKEYQRSQFLSPDALRVLQWNKLQQLLSYASENIPYYKKKWSSLGIRINDIRSMEDYGKLPVLTKDEIRKNYNDLISEEHRSTLIHKTTGGSSGQPLKFAITRESYERRMAVKYRGYSWVGAGLGAKTALLWVDPNYATNSNIFHNLKSTLYNRFFNSKVLNSFVMNESNMADYSAQLNSYNAPILIGYVGPLVELANFIEQERIQVYSPTAILTGAELLYQFQREHLEKTFRCPVYNTYGCREVMLIGSECKFRTGLHMNVDHLVIETLDEDLKQINNRLGHVAITDLHNYGMPLIRYINEDMAVISGTQCRCGINLPLLNSIEGRVFDMVYLSDNKKVTGGIFSYIIKDLPYIKQYQVIQDKIGEFKIKLALTGTPPQVKFDELRHKLEHALGVGTRLNFEIVEQIEVSSSGKHRPIVSNIK